MSFESWSAFFSMGGHGLYVWLAYAAALIVVLANVFSLRASWKRHLGEARALERRRSAAVTAATGSAGAPPAI